MKINRMTWWAYDALAASVKRLGLHRSILARPLFYSRPAIAARRTLMSRGPAVALVNGSKMVVPSDPIYAPGMLRGRYERETTDLCGQLLRSAMTVVDLGANVGFYTLLAARLVGPRGRVYAFEPHPVNLRLLERNIQLNKYDNVTTVPRAVSNFCGATSLVVGNGPGVSSLYSGPLTSAKTMDVETTTLDEFFSSEGWPAVDLIKIDIEGAECAALDGMSELSARNPGLKLIIEFGVDLMEAAGNTAEDFFEALRHTGFTRFRDIKRGLRLIDIPSEIPSLIHRWKASQTTNVLCEKE